MDAPPLTYTLLSFVRRGYDLLKEFAPTRGYKFKYVADHDGTLRLDRTD